MCHSAMSKIAELFGVSTEREEANWEQIVQKQICPFLGKKCYKVRKSDPDTSIGTCTVFYGEPAEPIVICPTRLTERQVFRDCFHLLTEHQPGNELHIVSEVSIPGGSVDYFLVSVKDGEVKDFVGIEVQALDTTGTVWPERQRFLRKIGIPQADDAKNSDKNSDKPFGMNWKMTAKTILVQLRHKIKTFEHVNKKLVLVVQDKLIEYMRREFEFNHLNNPADLKDSMHFHVYQMIAQKDDKSFKLVIKELLSTNADGIAKCLGPRSKARMDPSKIFKALQAKISTATRFREE